MNFVSGLLVSTDSKIETYNLIPLIIKRLIKMVHYAPVKIIINAFGPAKVIINALMHHQTFSNFIINNQRSVFNSKFSLSSYTFLASSAAFLLPSTCRPIVKISGITASWRPTLDCFLTLSKMIE